MGLLFVAVIVFYGLSFYYMLTGRMFWFASCLALVCFFSYLYVDAEQLTTYSITIATSLTLVQLLSLVYQRSFANKFRGERLPENLYSKRANMNITIILIVLMIALLVIKIPPTAIPWFQADLIEGRQNFNKEGASILRISKFILPFLNLVLLANILTSPARNRRRMDWVIFFFSSMIACLYEGSKSAFLSYFVLVNTFLFLIRYKSKVYNIFRIAILGFAFLLIMFLVQKTIASDANLEMGDFLFNRLLVDNAKSFSKSFQYVDNNGLYPDFLISPFKIFVNSLTGNTDANANIFPSLGNFLESDYNTPSEYEILVPFYLEGYVFGGIIGSLIFVFVNLIINFYLLSSFFKSFRHGILINAILYYYLLYENIAVIYRGKFSNSITTTFFTILPIYLILYVLRKLLNSLKKKPI